MAIPLKRYETMDPFILVSAVNMQLRDEFANLEDLCSYHEIDKEKLVSRLKEKNFSYDEANKQFK